jgi:hypothetical protein
MPTMKHTWKVDDHNLNMFLSPFFYSWLLCPAHALIKQITSAVEAFSCLHKPAKPSLHHYSNITWGYKTARRYFNFCLGYFLCSKTFHHHPRKETKASSILSRTGTMGLAHGLSTLPLLNTPPIPTVHLLQAIHSGARLPTITSLLMYV